MKNKKLIINEVDVYNETITVDSNPHYLTEKYLDSIQLSPNIGDIEYNETNSTYEIINMQNQRDITLLCIHDQVFDKNEYDHEPFEYGTADWRNQ